MIRFNTERVGYVAFNRYKDCLTIHRIWIEPDSRRRGIAISVLAGIVERVHELVGKPILMRTLVKRKCQLGRKLFKKFGLGAKP